MAGKHWYVKFDVDAWLSEEGLRVCCLEAHGLWFRCLCLMFKNEERRGYLEHKGTPITAEWLAKSVNVPVSKVEKLLSELENARVFSRDPNGVIYSRRMVRDEATRLQSQVNGKRGGNPRLKGGDNPPVNPRVKTPVGGGDKPSVTITSNSNSDSSFEGVQGEGEPNWLVIEAEFIRLWNQLEGVAKCSTNALPSNVVNEFQAAWRTPGWWERAEAAMRKFPLENGVVMSIRKFLTPTTIDEILGGTHDFEPGKRPRSGRVNSSLRHPDDAKADWNV